MGFDFGQIDEFSTAYVKQAACFSVFGIEIEFFTLNVNDVNIERKVRNGCFLSC